MHKFLSKMIIQENFNRKNILPALGIKQMAFQLLSSRVGITFLAGICISLIDHYQDQLYDELLVDQTKFTLHASSFPAVFSSPILYFYYTAEIPNYGTQCWITFSEQWQWQIYMTIVSMTLFVIPAILIAACYIIIVCTIWNKGKEMSVRGLLDLTDHLVMFLALGLSCWSSGPL